MNKIKGLHFEAGEAPKILILGTMPGGQSIEKQEYYSSPNNSFWTIIEQVFNDGKPFANYDEKCACLHNNGIALWDVFDSCDREKSLDKAIKEPVYNDIESFLNKYPTISLIVFNGKKAEEAFKKYNQLNIKTVTAPSTSNAFPMKREKKTALWKDALGLSKKEEKPVDTPQKEEDTLKSLEMTISGAPYIISMPIIEDEWKKDAKKLIKECDEENDSTDFRVDFYANTFRDYWEDEMMIVLYDEKEPVNILIQDRETEETVDQFTQKDVPLKICNDVVLDAGDIFFIKKCEDAKSYFSAKTIYSRDVFSFTKVKVKVGDRMMEGLVPFDFDDEDAFFNEMFTDFEIYNSCDDYSDETESLYINLNGNCTVIGEDLRPGSDNIPSDNNTQSSNNHQDTEKRNIRIEISGRGYLYTVVEESYLNKHPEWKDVATELIQKAEESGEWLEEMENDLCFDFKMNYIDPESVQYLYFEPQKYHPVYVKVTDTDTEEVIDEFEIGEEEAEKLPQSNYVTDCGYIFHDLTVHAATQYAELEDVEYSRENLSFKRVQMKAGEDTFHAGLEVSYDYTNEEGEDEYAYWEIEQYDPQNGTWTFIINDEKYELE